MNENMQLTSELYNIAPTEGNDVPVPELINETPIAEAINEKPVPELYVEEVTNQPITTPPAPGSAADVAFVAGMSFLWIAFMLTFLVAIIIAWWKIFTKAGEKGWKSLIPFYNVYVMLEIAGQPGWWFIWFFIPFVNIIFTIILYYNLSKVFGKGIGYTLGLLFLNPIFALMLAFGNAQYGGFEKKEDTKISS